MKKLILLFAVFVFLFAAGAALSEDYYEGEAVYSAAVPENPVHLTDNTVLKLVELGELTLPVPTGDGWQSARYGNYAYYFEKHEGDYMYQYRIVPITDYWARYGEIYDITTVEDHFTGKMTNAAWQAGGQSAVLRNEDYPLFIACVPNTMETRGDGIRGTLTYIRGSKAWSIEYAIYPESLFSNAATLQPELTDLEAIASKVVYNEKDSEVSLSIIAKDNPERITAGRQFQFKSAFSDTDKVNSKNKNTGVEWSVTDPEGNPVEGIVIRANGNLSVDRRLDHNQEIVVTLRSASFRTRDYYHMLAIPIVTNIAVDQEEVVFYLGSTGPVDVQASVTPECVPIDVLSWKSYGEKIVQVTDLGGGKARLEAVGFGKANVNVTEAGGKKGVVKVVVAREVTDIELSFSGKTKPGSTVSVWGAAIPKNATYRTLIWSLNVDDSIATINKNGQVRISKTAPAGTTITVVCVAEGAPSPVVRTIDLTVTE